MSPEIVNSKMSSTPFTSKANLNQPVNRKLFNCFYYWTISLFVILLCDTIATSHHHKYYLAFVVFALFA